MSQAPDLELLNRSSLAPHDVEQSLLGEVEDLRRIHRLSLRLTDADTLDDVLTEVLQTAVALVDARLGSVQIVNPDGTLAMIGQVGFGPDVVKQFSTVTLDDCSTCAAALNRRARVIVEDLRTDPAFTEIAAALRSYGAASAVSTPVLDKLGNVLAMFSVYWLEAHQPSERELRALDLCAELAGRHVERSVATRALRERDQRHVLLMRELAHRGKNLLTVIQAIAMRSLRDRSLDEARDVFIGRLGALASTYNTLTDEAAESVQLHDIASACLQSHSDRLAIHGPAILVPAKNAQTLGLALHELATNAAKYGAFSSSSGRVEIKWEITEGERFSFAWTEAGGPLTSKPAKKGFGSTILIGVVGAELNCAPEIEYRLEGLRYQLDCALKDLTGKPILKGDL